MVVKLQIRFFIKRLFSFFFGEKKSMNIYRKIKVYKAEKNIERVIKTKGNEIIRVGFIVQVESIWDKQEPVFTEMTKRNDIDVKLLVVPNTKWSNISEFDTYTNNYFLNKYADYAIKVFDDDFNLINVRELEFDYVFFPRPYDIHLPEGLRSSDLVKFTRCCYISYGYSLSDEFNDLNVNNSFFDNMYIIFGDSSYIQSLLYKKYKKSCDKKIRYVEYLGYPCLEKYLSLKPRSKIKTITWTPRWSYDEKIGGSNFIEYKNEFISFCKTLPRDVSVIFRPHPLMFDELIKTEKITQEEKDNYLKALDFLNVTVDYVSSIDFILEKTDLLITDFSSIIMQFFLTKRPIIYCKKNIEFNESGKKFEDFLYVSKSWSEVENRCEKLINDNDELLNDRIQFVANNFEGIKYSSKRITDRVVKDYRGVLE